MNKEQVQEIKELLRSLMTPKDLQEEIALRASSLCAAFLVQIEKMLEEKNWTQKKLAHKIGFSPSYLSQIFHSERLLNFKSLAKIEKALDIRFDVSIRDQIKNKNFECPTKDNISLYKITNNMENKNFECPTKDNINLYKITDNMENKNEESTAAKAA